MKALVQLRGEVNMAQDVHDTLQMLNIHDVNHCALVPETDAYRGMITKVNDYVAHGEPSQETVETLLRTRAEPLEGDAEVEVVRDGVGAFGRREGVAERAVLALFPVSDESARTLAGAEGRVPARRRDGNDGVRGGFGARVLDGDVQRAVTPDLGVFLDVDHVEAEDVEVVRSKADLAL